MRTHVSTLLTALLVAGATACDFERDYVAPGYYGATAQAGSRAMAAPPTSSTPRAAAGSPVVMEPAGAGAAGMAPSSPATNEPMKPMPSGMPPSAACDLSGRWLSTLHQVTDGLGQLQYVHKYIYYEIEQTGDTFTVKKGMQCLTDTVADGAFAIRADFSGAWQSQMRKVVYAGRTGTSAKVANGCKIDIAKLYTVYGATLPHYLDPSVPLPTAEQKAMGTTPGWEDWDGDANPGITGVLSGTVAGKIFVATREWTQLSGTVPNLDSVFKLALKWDQEPNVMAFDGSPFLGSEAVRAADANLHFAQFVRLSPDQATGADDDAVCKSLRELAPKLTPEAAGM